MPLEEPLSDDYVAGLLKSDAKTRSIKYSALGLQSFLPQRPTVNAPKPNTRFLRNIIRETDSHNAALLAKEAQESRARLQLLRGEPERFDAKRGSTKPGYKIHEEEGSWHKRRRIEDLEVEVEREYRSHHSSRRSRSCRSTRDRHEGKRRHGRRRGSESDTDERSENELRHYHYREERRRHRSSSREEYRRDEEKRRHRSRRKHISRSRSPARKEEGRPNHHRTRRRRHSSSCSPGQSIDKQAHQVTKPERTSIDDSHLCRPQSTTSASDSDPLEAIIGPPPPPPEPKIRSRGRGTFASSSTMDTHFTCNYDPTVDVNPDSGSENDWDQALEALRDRQRWRQQGADRLRAAGFTEEEVGKWEKGGEKREEDVRWAKHGEGREWDRGKVLDNEGETGLEPEWGRLKGT
ncbi:MAG: hypothetical protein M1835_002405 [Candelina submexicana]|nr:MAG: hypothetical protein M1835_002405 [Candelina submexicana]